MSKFLRRASEASTGAGNTRAAADEQFEGTYPHLFAQLTVLEWGKGKPRQTSTVTLFTDEGTWKASLNNRDEGLTLFGTGESFDQALAVLEEQLAAPAGPPWRKARDRDQRPTGGHKRS